MKTFFFLHRINCDLDRLSTCYKKLHKAIPSHQLYIWFSWVRNLKPIKFMPMAEDFTKLMNFVLLVNLKTIVKNLNWPKIFKFWHQYTEYIVYQRSDPNPILHTTVHEFLHITRVFYIKNDSCTSGVTHWMFKKNLTSNTNSKIHSLTFCNLYICRKRLFFSLHNFCDSNSKMSFFYYWRFQCEVL